MFNAKLSFVIILIWFLQPARAQTISKKFKDDKGFETDSASASYSEILEQVGNNQFRYISYYLSSGALRAEDETPDEKGLRVRKYYYPNGVLRAKGIFSPNEAIGPAESFYSDGRPQGEFSFEPNGERENKYVVTKVFNYWDSAGNAIVSNGEGYCDCNLQPFGESELFERGEVTGALKQGGWNGRNSDQTMTFSEVYNEGQLISGKQIFDSYIFEYKKVEEMALPRGGIIEFYQHVAKVMKYPPSARRRGIQGRVFVEFVVEQDGQLSNFKVLKGISPDCDAEALKAVRSSPAWNPGLQRGRPVKQRMVLPITFKIG